MRLASPSGTGEGNGVVQNARQLPPEALGNFHCGQGLWANPAGAKLGWGHAGDRVGIRGQEPAPLPWGCAGFLGTPGSLGQKQGGETKAELRAPGLPG